MKNPRLRWLAASAGLVLLIAAGTFAALRVAGIDVVGGGSAEPVVSQGAPVNPVLGPTRDRLSVCVQSAGVDGATAIAAKSSVELALAGVQEHPRWITQRFAELPAPVVNVDCQTKPGVYDYPVPDDPPKSFYDVIGRIVETPNINSVLIFILPSDEISRLEGEPPFRLSVEEVICGGDDCRQVTTGLYLSPNEITDVALIKSLIEKAIGLEAPF